jgi:DNA-binding transcriptional ArsR family regulator
MQMQSDVFQTLGDPTRLRIVEALLGGERAVSDIVDVVEIHQSGVSRHLRILSEAGFVRMRPEGPQRFYSLRPEPFRELDRWLNGYRALWEARLDRFAAALARKQEGHIARRKHDERRANPMEKKR